jgi:hypothetical protein
VILCVAHPYQAVLIASFPLLEDEPLEFEYMSTSCGNFIAVQYGNFTVSGVYENILIYSLLASAISTNDLSLVLPRDDARVLVPKPSLH